MSFMLSTAFSSLHAGTLLAASQLTAGAQSHLLPNASLSALQREQELLDHFDRGTLAERFTAIMNLAQFYLVNRKYGGQTGQRWAYQTKAQLVAHVVGESRYADFIATDPVGMRTIDLPREIAPPPFLQLNRDALSSAIIRLKREPQRRRNYHVYFPLSLLLSAQDYVLDTDLAEHGSDHY